MNTAHGNNGQSVDYSPLRRFATLFELRRRVRRIRMVAVRVVFWMAVLAALAYIAIVYVVAMRASVEEMAEFDRAGETVSHFGFEHSGTIPVIEVVGLLFAVWIVWQLALWANMHASMRKFAQVNGYEVKTSDKREAVQIPSFRGRRFGGQSPQVDGVYRGAPFTLIARMYKEGGLLRWRKHHMDTILEMELPLGADLKSIVIDACEGKLRRNDMTAKFEPSWRFQFEGVHGAHYDVYTDPLNRVEALSLFTPDVVDIIYQQLPGFNVEIQSNKIWLIKRYQVLNDVSAQAAIEGGNALRQALARRLRLDRIG